MKTKLIILTIIGMLIIPINLLKAAGVKKVKIDNKTIFASHYKPADFYGEWVNTGAIKYICSAEEPKQEVAINDFFQSHIPSLGGERYNPDLTPDMQFEAKFYDNDITPQGSYAGGSTDHEFYNRWHPIKYTYLKKDSVCGNQNILVIQFGKEEALKEVGDNKTGQDNFIIINLNKIIVKTDQKGQYSIFERKKTIAKNKKFDLYMYDIDKDNEKVKAYQKDKTYNVYLRKWQPNEDITKVVE